MPLLINIYHVIHTFGDGLALLLPQQYRTILYNVSPVRVLDYRPSLGELY